MRARYDEGGLCTSIVESCPDRTFEITIPIVVGHSCARYCTEIVYTTLNATGKIGASRRVNVDSIVVNTAAHDVDIAVGLEGVSVGTGTDRGCM